ncbi:hypothetical protein ODJ79_26650 [Actinoplanes sp. KI2]|uniref:hypothetical protein n=1 Tax=Actinoplanes sp. KI2 TaxID=2983315 RepID=UPI0021D5BD44|nr:hypothetical protein [Actinoplanes sp. KI2]MCU7727326.1 hypothetical protein [Actinoplanes sp. KI2]
MSSTDRYSGFDEIRRADAYPRVLRAARLYVGGLAWGMISALIVACADLSAWFLLTSALAIPFIWAGVRTALDAWSRLEQEVPETARREARSASIIVAFQDLLKRRR